MFVMSMLDRLTDVKKSTYAKVIAVLVSIAMVLSLTNMSAFAEGDGFLGVFGGDASDTVEVAVDLENTKIEYGDQIITADDAEQDATFEAPAGKDLKFKASATTEDFTLDEVALVTTAENGDEIVTDLEAVDGQYCVEAADVTDGIVLRATAVEQVSGNNAANNAGNTATTITEEVVGDESAGIDATDPDAADNGSTENGTPESEGDTTENDTTEGSATETPATDDTNDGALVADVATETVANTVSDSVVSFAKAFTANTGIETYAAEPMADSTYTVKVGDTINLYGKRGYTNNQWSSNNTNIATVQSNGSSAIVTGKQAGTVTIVHTYTWWGYKYTETFVVTVTEHIEDAYFYFVLPGKSSTSTDANDYMYAGSGQVSIPSGFDYTNNKTRWSNGSNHNNAPFVVEDYVVKMPSDQAIRQGLREYYGNEYNDNWTYEITYLNLVGQSTSTGYKRENLIPFTRCHVDMAITINRNDQVAFNYLIQQPDGSVVSNSTMHKKSTTDSVQVNSSVKDSGSFATDGYQYQATLYEKGIKYTFDGWYTDSSYQTKAENNIAPNEQRTFYAHYVTNPHTVTYDTNGGKFADNTTSSTAHQDAGTVVTIRSDVPTRDGYEFAGWKSNVSGQVFVGGRQVSMPDQDVILTAQWNPIAHILIPASDDHSNFTEPSEYQYLHSETEKFAVKFKADEGYEIDSVTVDGKALSGDELAAAIKDGITLDQTRDHSVAITSRQLVSYTVKYLDEANQQPVATEKIVNGIAAGSSVSEDAIDIDQYVLVGETTQTKTADENTTFVFLYAKDVVVDPKEDKNGNEPGDGIPDKYQITVKFVSSDNAKGVLEGITSYVVTLKDVDGAYVEKGTHTPDAKDVEFKSATGYEFDKWSPKLEVCEVVGGKTYTYTAEWKAIQYAWSVNFYFDDQLDSNYVPKDLADQPISGKADYNTMVSYKPFSTVDYNDHHYVLVSDESVNGIISDDVTKNIMNVKYELDDLGGTPEKPGDNIPDKYQKVITFIVKNGSWGTTINEANKDNITKVVTLTKEGKPAVDGTYTVASTDVPNVGFVPDAGYMAGNWEVQPVEYVLSDNTYFRYTYDVNNGETHRASYVVNYYKDDVLARTDGQINGDSVWVNERAAVTVNAQPIDLEGAFDGYVIDAQKTINENNLVINSDINGEIEQLRDALGKLQFVNDEPSTANKQFDVNIYYKAAPSTIIFVTNGGTAVDSNSGTTFQPITDRTMPITTREGYVFAGWYENADLSGYIESMLPETYPVGGKTYYARWISAAGFTKVYNGQYNPTEITVSGVENIDKNNVKIYKQITNEDGSKALGEIVDNRFTNVDQTGTYAVTVSKGTDTFVIYDIPVEITPAPITIVANDDSKMFGEEDNTSYNGSVVQGTVYPNDEIGVVTYQRTNAEVNDAGYYEDVIVPSIAKAEQNGNYSYQFGPGNYTIRPADSNNVTAESITKTYDAQEAAVSGQAAIEGSTVEYSVDGVNYTSESPRFANVGTYTVYVRATLDNYEPVTTTARVVINPAPVTVTVNDATKTVATDDPEFSAVVEGLFGDDTIDYTIARPGVGTDEAVGVYQGALVATGEATQGNYVVNFVPGDFTITAPVPANPANPGNPGGGDGTPVPTPVPGVPADGPAAALAPLAAALAAPVEALIGDEPTPLAEETIGDDEDPLAAFDHVNCWVHYYMILGILLTLVYGGCVIARRSNYSRKIQKMDDYATGKAMDTVEETENVANAAAQKMEA